MAISKSLWSRIKLIKIIKMIKNIFTISMLSSLFLISCNEIHQQEKGETTIANTNKKTTNEIVTSTSIDKNGKKLELTFNNTKQTVTLLFNGEIIEMIEQTTGSGMRYKNDHIELKKDGTLVFTHQDEIITSSVKNKKG
jgi:membrane-bound inhibitor of C-type lysozyme